MSWDICEDDGDMQAHITSKAHKWQHARKEDLNV